MRKPLPPQCEHCDSVDSTRLAVGTYRCNACGQYFDDTVQIPVFQGRSRRRDFDDDE